MTASNATFNPTQWLLAPAAYKAIVTDPATLAAGGPLLRLRLASGHVHRMPPGDLAAAFAQLAAPLPGAQWRLVLDVPDQAGIGELRRCAGLVGSLRVHVWRDACAEVLASLDAPDDAVIDCWRGVLERDASMQRLVLPPDQDAAWLASFCAALRDWAGLARSQHGADAFDEAYPPRLFDWSEFDPEYVAGERAVRHRHRLLPLLSFITMDDRPRLEGLLTSAPLEKSEHQVLHLRGAAANAPGFALPRTRMRRDAGTRRIEAAGKLGRDHYRLSIALPPSADGTATIAVTMPWRLAFGVDAVEIGAGDAASGAPPLVTLGPPLLWQKTQEKAGEISLEVVCNADLLAVLGNDPLPPLWLRRLPAAAPDLHESGR